MSRVSRIFDNFSGRPADLVLADPDEKNYCGNKSLPGLGAPPHSVQQGTHDDYLPKSSTFPCVCRGRPREQLTGLSGERSHRKQWGCAKIVSVSQEIANAGTLVKGQKIFCMTDFGFSHIANRRRFGPMMNHRSMAKSGRGRNV